MNQQLIFIELNEINFEYVRAYCATGELPALGALLQEHQLLETTSEKKYEDLEPWIQWVTAHTGLTLDQHGIYRLGDIARSDPEQIWEYLEKNGKAVGAISPMNAKNRCADPAFFMPDPWTLGEVIGPPLLRRLYQSIAQAVNDNAQARISPGSAFWLLLGIARYARPSNYRKYVSYMLGAVRGKAWTKALILDLLIADVFHRLVKRDQPDFASVFLNAGAHIQHHYMFNSSVYAGPLRNPDWYVDPTQDPVLDVYRLYDRIVGGIRRSFPDARLMVATGLHQDPHSETTFYWRLKDHAAFLARNGIPYRSIEPRMSRDFVVNCTDAAEAKAAEDRLTSITSEDGRPLFDVDNRGQDLFVMLVWAEDISENFVYRVGNMPRRRFREDVAFVAIKNGEHNGIGYLIDTGGPSAARERIPLTSMPARICEAFGINWQPA
jgi:hypothetical protein